MNQTTDTDIQQIKDLIAAGNATTQKQIADLAISTHKQIGDLREEVRVGFANIETKFTKVDGELKEVTSRLTAVENNLKGLDTRLWGFGGIILGAVLAALLTIFGRFLFTSNPLS
jgi:uncharacterized tellurite resistance protein B-like protein